jgi:hypothetical protein
MRFVHPDELADLALDTPDRIRRAVPLARQAAMAVKSGSESSSWKLGRFTGLPTAIYQNWLYERNRDWHFTDGALCVLWCVELPDARCDYADKHHYIASTRREYNAGRHQADAPSVPSIAYFRATPAAQHQPAPRRGPASPTPALPPETIVPLPATPPPLSASSTSEPLRLGSHPGDTAARIRAMDDYMAANVLSGRQFVCERFASCRASHAGDYYEGQLHHVGSHFDLTLNGHAFCIVVVGQEYGNGPALVTRHDRTHDVVVSTGHGKRFRTDGDFPARNPHMRGTTSLLRLLVGRNAGGDYGGEWLVLDEQRIHIFEAFALVNFLLCSAIDTGQGRTGSKHGRSSGVMQANCADHFLAVVALLEPTVVVAQGKGVRNWMRPVLGDPVSTSPNLERASFGGHSCLLASFAHPSVPSRENWGTDERRPYLLDVVGPTVRAIHHAVLIGS